MEIDECVAPPWSAANEDVREVVVLATSKRVCVLRGPDPDAVRTTLTKVYNETGIWSMAVCLLHSLAHNAHEHLVGKVSAKVNFMHILLLSASCP